MYISLKSKIMFLIVMIMVITAVAIMYFTRKDVGSAMLAAEEASAHNVLHLVELNIKGGYNKLISAKIEILFRLEEELKNVSTICGSVFKDYARLSETRQLSKQTAQDYAVKWLKSIKFKKGKLFVFDRNGIIIGHSDLDLQGTSIAKLRDMKGRLISKVMRDDVLNESGDSAVFSWDNTEKGKTSNKMGYFIPVPGWEWTLGVVIDFGYIEAESQKTMESIIKVLSDTFNKIQIANSGFAFLFNGKKEIMIMPGDNPDKGYHKLKNMITGNLMLDDLIEAAHSENPSIRYAASLYDKNSEMQAYIRYFKAFDWYFAVSVPVHEIQEPAKALVTQQLLIITTIFFRQSACSVFAGVHNLPPT